MTNSTSSTLLLQLAIVVPVAFAAGWLGSQFGSDPDGSATAATPPPGQGSLLPHLTELDRRLEVLEDRVAATERQDGSLGDKLSDLGVRVEQLERAPAPAPVAAGSAADASTATDEPLGKIEQEQFENIQTAVAKQLVATQRQWLPFQMKLLADATAEGADKRRSQAISEAAAVERDFAGDRESLREPLREIYLAHWSRGASEIGPLVTRGLDNCDLDLVRSRLTELMAETDGKVAALLEGEALKVWNKKRADHRKLVADLLTRETTER